MRQGIRREISQRVRATEETAEELFRSRWIAVGARTADALVEFGVQAEVPEAENSEGILSSAVPGDVSGQRMLLLWDNFETTFSMPDPRGTTQPLDEAERAAMGAFLAAIGSRVIASGSEAATSSISTPPRRLANTIGLAWNRSRVRAR